MFNEVNEPIIDATNQNDKSRIVTVSWRLYAGIKVRSNMRSDRKCMELNLSDDDWCGAEEVRRSG